MIDLSALRLRRYPQRQRGDPFPIAIVTQIGSTRLTTLHHLINYLRSLEHHAPLQLFLADGQQFHRLHEIVAEPTIEIPLYPTQLCF